MRSAALDLRSPTWISDACADSARQWRTVPPHDEIRPDRSWHAVVNERSSQAIIVAT